LAIAKFYTTADEALRQLESSAAKLELHSTFLMRVKKHVECNICIDIPVNLHYIPQHLIFCVANASIS
jgi:hypothetical protein